MRQIKLIIAALFVFSPFAANATTVVDFETKTPFFCEFEDQTDGGLSFQHDFAACFYGPSPDNADFPTEPTSVVMGIGFSDILVTEEFGGIFDLISADLAFGPFRHDGLLFDETLVTGFLSGGGTVQTLLTVGYEFETYVFNWTDLIAVEFGELVNASEYLAFDNIVYNVPEPATLALLGLGIAGIGLVRRRRKV